MKPTQKSGKNDPQPGKSRGDNQAADAAANLQQLLDQFRPVVEFHQADETAGHDDIRIHWDVRLLRGRGTPFARNTGTSTLPGALADKSLILAPSLIEEEIASKIARPLSGRFQEEIERQLDESGMKGFRQPGYDGDADAGVFPGVDAAGNEQY